MYRLQFSAYLRGLLGRSYSIADEEGEYEGLPRLVVAQRGKDEVLVVETLEEWIRNLPLQPVGEDQVLLKHLAICVKRFFASPERLPSRSFIWPGTPRSRSHVRLALDPRKERRLGAVRRDEHE